MSAVAIIRTQDVPPPVFATRALHHDEATGSMLIAFDGCPLVGFLRDEQVEDGEIKPESVEYSFPRGVVLRSAFTDWLLYHGISFTVIV
ncbi:hypothetical protein [Paraburkholderia tuberum]|uniref:Uncharacterized protein n=1 Tax=Paraburkholderia tuberum TaxID=157910 RepID=A0A1H1JB75_9BURK|nr:hypothetical protein [Paraburkholderia tuberum]SDR47219.1 hypothetical protein SAMN05445850_4523 [Paraburkholderia tuberum]